MDYFLETAISCGAGLWPNECNAEMLVVFTPHAFKKFSEMIVAESEGTPLLDTKPLVS